MAKPKATTLQQKFGFMDGELSTPLHDEIMLWLDTYILEAVSNVARIPLGERDWTKVSVKGAEKPISLEEARKLSYDKVSSSLEKSQERMSCNSTSRPHIRETIQRDIDLLSGWIGPQIPEYGPMNIKRKIWESAIFAPNKFMVGFMDMLAIYENPILYLDISGIVPKFDVFRYDQYMAFEVKPEIPSLGELIRQIRMYQSYVDFPFCIVSPDDRFKDALASQGIKFLKYTG